LSQLGRLFIAREESVFERLLNYHRHTLHSIYGRCKNC
jgi:hypothetical protein